LSVAESVELAMILLIGPVSFAKTRA